MRIAVPMRRIALFAILFVIALLFSLPLRFVIGGTGLSAREASGTVWSGHLQEARVGPAVLGDLDARLLPLLLLTGQTRLEVARPSTAPDRLSAVLGLSRNRRSVESASGLIPVDGAFGAIPVVSVELTGFAARFRDRECDRAKGLVRANLSGDTRLLNLPPFVDAAARCDRGAVLLPFETGAGGRIEMRIFGDGHWDMRLPR